MKIEIFTDTDHHDCETCGDRYAEGGKVYVDDKLIIDKPAHASCFGGDDFSRSDLLVLALDKLGFSVSVDDSAYHITCHDEGYHGPLED